MDTMTRLAPISGRGPTPAAILRASETGSGLLTRTPTLPLLGHGAQLAAKRATEQRTANATFYAAAPMPPPPPRSFFKTRHFRAIGQRPPEAEFTKGAKYAGERGGFRVERATGWLRTMAIRLRRSQAAVTAAEAATVAAAAVLAPKPAAAPVRKVRAKKAVAA